MVTNFKDAVRGLNQGLPCGRYIVKLATTDAEKEAVYRLRFRVFNEELGEGIPENAATGMDVDEYDPFCDHLLLITDNRVVATYRLLYGPNRPPSGFYTESEFSLKSLPADFENTVELGRACIESAYRQKTTLMTLFWGLHCYCEYRNAIYLLGCGTLNTKSKDVAEATYADMKQKGHVVEVPGVGPLPKNQFQGNATGQTPELPSLLNLYIEFGAKIYSRPAYDPIFRCFDLLIVFHLQGLSEWGNELLKRFDRRLVDKSS